jgi:hypothetical protein
VQRDAQEKMDRSSEELAGLARELRYTQQVVASELASWQEERVGMGRRALREFARRMVVTEKARLESMKRAVRGLGIGQSRPPPPPPFPPPNEDQDQDQSADGAESGSVAGEEMDEDEEQDQEDGEGIVNGDVDAAEHDHLLGASSSGDE